MVTQEWGRWDMRVLSLFSGLGAHDLGLQWAGMKIAGQVEIDEYCQTILQKHWPKVPKWTDIRSVTANSVRSRCGKIDLITGGFPCQDISLAGKQAGIKDGKRSGLWREMWRLINEIRPAWIIIENVPALRTNGSDTILFALETIGYSCWPLVVGAWAIGAPHQRNRVWIVANSNSQHLRQQPGRRSRTDWQDTTLPSKPRQTTERQPTFAFPARPDRPQYPWEAPRLTEPEVGRSTARTTRRLALKALGNANPPQIPMLIGQAILSLWQK